MTGRDGEQTTKPDDWVLDHEAIEEQAKRLGLKRRVIVKKGYNRRKGGLLGSYRIGSEYEGREYHEGALVHRIVIVARQSAAEASRTVHHELEHARQREDFEIAAARDLVKANAARQANKALPYAERPDEIDARAAESRADTYPLVKTRG